MYIQIMRIVERVRRAIRHCITVIVGHSKCPECGEKTLWGEPNCPRGHEIPLSPVAAVFTILTDVFLVELLLRGALTWEEIYRELTIQQ